MSKLFGKSKSIIKMNKEQYEEMVLESWERLGNEEDDTDSIITYNEETEIDESDPFFGDNCSESFDAFM